MPQRPSDPSLQDMLDRAVLREQILTSTSMADNSEACKILGLSLTNPPASMARLEKKTALLKFAVDGKPAYPIFQFDPENAEVLPAIKRILNARPEGMSDLSILHWLTLPHAKFDGEPAFALKSDPDFVVQAFISDNEAPLHG